MTFNKSVLGTGVLLALLAAATAVAQDVQGSVAPPQVPTQTGADGVTYQSPTAMPAAPVQQPAAQPQQPAAVQQVPVPVPVQQDPVIAQAVASPDAPPYGAPAALPPLPPPSADIDRYREENLSVTPAQIREIYQILRERQQAVANPGPAPKSVTGTVSVSMTPGSTPPIIRTHMGYSTSMVVVDSSGAPWPVENFRVGNASVFEVSRLDAAQGSVFSVTSMAPFGQTNLVFKLVGVPTPVVVGLVSGQREVDARVEVRVSGRGPNATAPSAVTLPKGVDSRLLPVLNGLSPAGGKPLLVSGVDGVSAWMMPSGRFLVRTPFKIISPASPSFISSADGTHVYEFMPTPQLMGLVDGNFVQMRVSGW